MKRTWTMIDVADAPRSFTWWACRCGVLRAFLGDNLSRLSGMNLVLASVWFWVVMIVLPVGWLLDGTAKLQDTSRQKVLTGGVRFLRMLADQALGR